MKKEYVELEVEITKWKVQDIFCSGENTGSADDDDIYWTPNY